MHKLQDQHIGNFRKQGQSVMREMAIDGYQARNFAELAKRCMHAIFGITIVTKITNLDNQHFGLALNRFVEVTSSSGETEAHHSARDRQKSSEMVVPEIFRRCELRKNQMP